MNSWLAAAADALALEAGVPRDQLELSEPEITTLLDLARVAAHDSGDRRNAPLLCYLVGRGQGTRSLDGLVEAVRRSTS
jgi:uncharacterized protein DUF6457